ncbi:hypothetical protein HUQ62_002996 [Escherichia coli]|nr:hypothetical protein [Escherichia coli]
MEQASVTDAERSFFRNIAFIEEVGKHSASKYAIDESYGDVVEPPTTASFLCAYRDTEHGCKFSQPNAMTKN